MQTFRVRRPLEVVRLCCPMLCTSQRLESINVMSLADMCVMEIPNATHLVASVGMSS